MLCETRMLKNSLSFQIQSTRFADCWYIRTEQPPCTVGQYYTILNAKGGLMPQQQQEYAQLKGLFCRVHSSLSQPRVGNSSQHTTLHNAFWGKKVKIMHRARNNLPQQSAHLQISVTLRSRVFICPIEVVGPNLPILINSNLERLFPLSHLTVHGYSALIQALCSIKQLSTDIYRYVYYTHTSLHCACELSFNRYNPGFLFALKRVTFGKMSQDFSSAKLIWFKKKTKQNNNPLI